MPFAIPLTAPPTPPPTPLPAPAGFAGSRCEEDVNECGSSPCANGGQCQDQPGSFHCECLPGKRGSDAEGERGGGRGPQPLSVPCALCPGFAGPRCQAEVDECLSGPCPPGASCLDLPGTYFCLCPSGFTGQQEPLADSGYRVLSGRGRGPQ